MCFDTGGNSRATDHVAKRSPVKENRVEPYDNDELINGLFTASRVFGSPGRESQTVSRYQAMGHPGRLP